MASISPADAVAAACREDEEAARVRLAAVKAALAEAKEELSTAQQASGDLVPHGLVGSYADQVRHELAQSDAGGAGGADRGGVEFKSDAAEGGEGGGYDPDHPLGHHDESRTLVVDSEQEGLGPNYRDTPWVKPNVAAAMAYRRQRVFGGGHAPICSTGVRDMEELGAGLQLYFILLKVRRRESALLYSYMGGIVVYMGGIVVC